MIRWSLILTVFMSSFSVFAYDNWGPVTPSGFNYKITLTPSTKTPQCHAPIPFIVKVQSTGVEPLIVSMGVIVNGEKQELCNIPVVQPTNQLTASCQASFTTTGRQNLYAEIYEADGYDLKNPVPVFTCLSRVSSLGCRGTYSVNVR